jgi:hypothetical protein
MGESSIMRNHLVSLFVAPALVLAMSAWSQAAVLAQYTFGVNEATQTLAAETVAPGVTASAVNSVGTELGKSDYVHVQGPGWWFGESNGAGGNVAAMSWKGNAYEPAITGAQDGGPAYFAFTVTPNAGTTMLLTDLQFKVGKAAAVQAPFFYVNTDVDGFGSTQYIDSGPITAQPSGGALNWQTETVDLSAAKYQGLDSITFRIYYYGDWGPEGFWDDITVNGAVAAVPEPAALSVLGLGGVMMLTRRRR